MSNLAITRTQLAGQSSNGLNENWADLFPYTVSQSFMLLGKILWFLLLLGLFVLSFLVWVWIASFRNGWRFWQWAYERRFDPQQTTIGLLYGVVILFVSPFFLFVDWTQRQFDKVLPEWMKLPTQVSFRKLFEERLGIKLGKELPFFIEADQEMTEQQALSSNSD